MGIWWECGEGTGFPGAGAGSDWLRNMGLETLSPSNPCLVTGAFSPWLPAARTLLDPEKFDVTKTRMEKFSSNTRSAEQDEDRGLMKTEALTGSNRSDTLAAVQPTRDL